MTTTAAAGRGTDREHEHPVADGRPRSRALAPLAWALLAVVLGVAIPLAPVTAAQTVVTWPRAGEPAASTTLALAPPRPLALDAVVPCGALAGTGPVTALSTLPSDAPEAARGLTVTADGTGDARRVTVTVSGTTLATVPLGPAPCRLAVHAGSDGAGVTRDGVPLPASCGACAGVLPPEVSRLATDAPASPGLAVRLLTDDRYDSSPSTLKTVLLVAHLVALAGLAVTLVRRARRRGDPRPPGRWRRGVAALRAAASPADAVLLAVSLVWVVLTPAVADDSWYPLMARGAAATGSMTNAVYMFDVTEAPFVAAQEVLRAWGAVGGWSLAWLRLLPLLYGLGVWVLLRVLLARAAAATATAGPPGPTAGLTARRAPWALLVAHLAWWLPFGMTLRPEPLIVLLAAVVLVAVDRAGTRGSLPALAVAAAAGALALTCSPTGLVALAPVAVEAPRLWARFVAAGWRGRLTAAAVVAAAASVAVPVAFGDATLGDVVEAASVHTWYYAGLQWFDELTHYDTLLAPGSTPWGRRGPVLLTLAVLVVVAVGSGRRAPDDDGPRRLMRHAAATTAVAFVLLAASPTKWVLHFGAVEASATVLIAAALLRAPLPRGERAVAAGASVAAIVIAASVSFAGGNVWTPFSDRGQPFGPHTTATTRLDGTLLTPHLGPVFLSDPLVWVAVALVAVAWARVAAGRPGWWGRLPRPDAPRAVLLAVGLTLVVGMVGVFTLAPLRMSPGWTVASGVARDVVGPACGLRDTVSVLAPSAESLGPPATPPVLSGDFAGSDRVPPPRPVPGLGTVWHDAVPGGTGRGGIVTGWYPVPAGDATAVVVPLLDTGSTDRTLTVELAEGDATAPRPVASRPLPVKPAADARTWLMLPVDLTDLPRRPTALRLVVSDGSGAPVAVGEPRLARPAPVAPLVVGHRVRADQMMASFWPCEDQAFAVHGIARPPDVLLLTGDDLGATSTGLPTVPELGGVWRTDELESTHVRLASSIPGGPVSTRPWGFVETVVRDLPTERVDTVTTTRSRSGTERLPTLAARDYVGVADQGPA